MIAQGSSAQTVLEVTSLADGEGDAAAEFYGIWRVQAQALLNNECASLVLVLPDAPQNHRDWRRAAVGAMARAAAPARVNMVSGGDRLATEAAIAYLEAAPGITGQYLPLNGADAETGATRTMQDET